MGFNTVPTARYKLLNGEQVPLSTVMRYK